MKKYFLKLKKLGYISIEIVIIAAIMLVSGFTAVGSFVEDGQKATNDAASKIDETLNLAGGSEGAGPGGSGGGAGGGELPEIPDGPEEPVTMEAGLYDADDVLLASWNELINVYGLEVDYHYDVSGILNDTYLTNPQHVLNDSNLISGTKIVFSENITNIGRYSFWRIDRLNSVVLPEGLLTISASAFEETGIKEIVIPKSVVTIKDYALRSCNNLLKITFKEGSDLTTLGNAVFQDLNIESITLPNKLQTIGDQAFQSTKLKSITIPSSVTKIGSQAFYDCKLLEDIYYAGSEDEWNLIQIGSWNDGLSNATIHFNSTGPTN